MKIGTVGTIVAVVIAVGSVYGLADQYKDRVLWEQEAKENEARLDSLKAAHDSVQAERARTDSIALAKSDSLQRVASASRANANRWRGEARNTRNQLDSVVESLPDSVQVKVEEFVDSLTVQHERQVNSLEIIIEARDGEIVLLDSRLLAVQKVEASLHRQLAEANRQLEFYKGQAKPGLFADLKGDLPKLGLAALVGAVTWEIIR